MVELNIPPVEDLRTTLGDVGPLVDLGDLSDRLERLRIMGNYCQNLSSDFTLIDCRLAQPHSEQFGRNLFLGKVTGFRFDSGTLVFDMTNCYYSQEQFVPEDTRFRPQYTPEIAFTVLDDETGGAILRIIPQCPISFEEDRIDAGYVVKTKHEHRDHDTIRICHGNALIEWLKKRKNHLDVFGLREMVRLMSYGDVFLDDKRYAGCFKTQEQYLIEEFPIKPRRIETIRESVDIWLDIAVEINSRNQSDERWKKEFGKRGFYELLRTKSEEIDSLWRDVTSTKRAFDELPDLDLPEGFKPQIEDLSEKLEVIRRCLQDNKPKP